MVEQPEEQKHVEKLSFNTYREYFDDSYKVTYNHL